MKILMHMWGKKEPAEVDADNIELASEEENQMVYRNPVTNIYTMGQAGSRRLLYPAKVSKFLMATTLMILVGCGSATVEPDDSAHGPQCAGPDKACATNEDCFISQCATHVCDAGVCQYFDDRSGEQCVGHTGQGVHLVGVCDMCDCRLQE